MNALTIFMSAGFVALTVLLIAYAVSLIRLIVRESGQKTKIFPDLARLPNLKPPEMRSTHYSSAFQKRLCKDIEEMTKMTRFRLSMANNGAMPAPTINYNPVYLWLWRKFHKRR